MQSSSEVKGNSFEIEGKLNYLFEIVHASFKILTSNKMLLFDLPCKSKFYDRILYRNLYYKSSVMVDVP